MPKLTISHYIKVVLYIYKRKNVAIIFKFIYQLVVCVPMENSFNLEYTIKCLTTLHAEIKNKKQVLLEQFCQVLDQFCFIFKEVNSFLGLAFSDVKEKSAAMRANQKRFPGYAGLISFIEMEMQKKIHTYNSKNGKQNKGAPPQLKTYSSTARNLLRMMWLLTYLKVTFTRLRDYPKEDLSATFGVAYDQAFGDNHSWLLKKSAKVAIYATASKDKTRINQVFMGKKCTQQETKEAINKFLEQFLPLHSFLWDFYKQNKIDRLQ